MIKWARPSDLQCFWKDSEESCSILSLPCLIPFPCRPLPAICWPGHGYFLLFICSTITWPFLWQLKEKRRLKRLNFKCSLRWKWKKNKQAIYGTKCRQICQELFCGWFFVQVWRVWNIQQKEVTLILWQNDWWQIKTNEIFLALQRKPLTSKNDNTTQQILCVS